MTFNTSYEHISNQPENPFSNLPKDQNIAIIPEFKLENGQILNNIPVAYKTYGQLNEAKDNVMVICHALTGSADVGDWWGPLLGPFKSFDPSNFFIFCGNVIGSPYGTLSPCTMDPTTGRIYGKNLPKSTIRDDIRLHKLVLDSLGVNSIAICIGGSLGGMQVLEWGMLGKKYVKNLVAIATSGKHSAWGISWGEAQRQAIYSDPLYLNGSYTFDRPPKSGLAAARMSALLTYRSRNSFETRFGRQTKDKGDIKSKEDLFSAQSYLRYQGEKFVKRFDANCYIHLTQKMDLHDLSYQRGNYHEVLKSIEQNCLIIGIESDGLFTINEQIELSENIPNSQFAKIESPDGHDGFLLEFEQLDLLIRNFIKKYLPEYYSEPNGDEDIILNQVKHVSMFGEDDEVEEVNKEKNIIEW